MLDCRRSNYLLSEAKKEKVHVETDSIFFLKDMPQADDKILSLIIFFHAYAK